MLRPEIILRRFKRNIGLKLISIVCLGVAFACVLLLIAYAKFELSYDQFHTNAGRIARLTLEPREGLADARMYGNSTRDLPKSIPEVEAVSLIAPIRQGIFRVNDKSFNLSKAYMVDSLFFRVFSCTIKEENRNNPLPSPQSIIVSETFKTKYLGSEPAMGQILKMASRDMPEEQTYTITGVFEDFPANSHFRADVLAHLPVNYEHFFYTYLLLESPGAIGTVPDKLVALYKSKTNDTTNIPKYNLQPVTQIHLHSNKAREMERNGNYQSLTILISAVVLVLVIALINLANNSRVLFLLNIEYYTLKRTHGATFGVLIMEELIHALITSTIIVILGFWAHIYLGRLLNVDSVGILSNSEIALISLAFVALLILVMVIPVGIFFVRNMLTSITNLRQIQTRRNRMTTMKGFIIVQVAISIFVLVLSLGISRQMNYIMKSQPGGRIEGIILLPDQPQKAVRNFDLLKAELLQNPKILGITAAMEPPAGAIRDRSMIEFEGELQASPTDILCVDNDFFSVFDLRLKAGTMMPRYPYSFDWESKAINATFLAMGGYKPTVEFDFPDDFSDSYLINAAALAQFGLKSPEEAIGKRVKLKDHPVLNIIPGGRVVGVVSDLKYTSFYEKERPLLILQRRMFTDDLFIRYEAQCEAEAIKAIQEAWGKINPLVPLTYKPLHESYREVYSNEYNSQRILAYFSLLSLLIASLGLAVMVSYFIKYRIKEIGIRKVNGATSYNILMMLNTSIIRWVIAGLAIATPLAYIALKHWLKDFAYQAPLGGWIFVLAGAIALLVALLTVSWQTWRAARMNPVEAIRYE